MKNTLSSFIVIVVLILSSVSVTLAFGQLPYSMKTNNTGITGNYTLQWSLKYGTDPRTCARFQGPQPIGDADNDGKNELLISGRDGMLRVMKWDDQKQNYSQARILRPPLYPIIHCDAGGMAIGDVTNDGKNEIAATWYDAIYKYFLGKYWIIGMNPWIFANHGGSADCLIGDCDNDGKNELIVSGGPLWESNVSIPQITVFKWNGLWLRKVAGWTDPKVHGYVYMAGLGDVNNNGKNEIACAYADKLMVLQWDSGTKLFQATLVKQYPHNYQSPFGCVCKDCDGDGTAEILLSFEYPRIAVFKWNGSGYVTQYDHTWSGADPVIEGIDVGDTDGDDVPEVCAGAGMTHILQWNGTTYVEEATLPTYGWMAVVSIGDCDNDGKNEINAGNVDTEDGLPFMEWIFKYQADG